MEKTVLTNAARCVLEMDPAMLKLERVHTSAKLDSKEIGALRVRIEIEQTRMKNKQNYSNQTNNNELWNWGGVEVKKGGGGGGLQSYYYV